MATIIFSLSCRMPFMVQALCDALADQPLRTENQHQHQHNEGKDVPVVAARTKIRPTFFDEAEDQPTNHRAPEVADAAMTAAVNALRPSMKPMW